MDDIKQLMQLNYLKYASYVILDRAIPNVVDGLKPVQRRILFTLWMMHDGKLHKVANVAGQTMAYHPHGDAPIVEALVNMSNKGYLLDQQGNFGNMFTGDPAAAARYIETRLSDLAQSTMFNPELTQTIPSYDGRHQEPISLPAKIPLVLMQGADGIAVGMATHILPHNFVELLEAEIAILEGREYTIVPDFPTGGIMDASEYEKGKGKVKLRAKIEIRDPKTLVITEICYGTTTESLIRSIDEAAKKGKIKIDSINDYTAEKVEIEIKLPRGQYAPDLIDALHAYTECEIVLNSSLVVIKDNLPWEPTVNEVLEYHTELLQGYLSQELEIERKKLYEKIFNKTLEQIFIENRLYKTIENISSYDKIHGAIELSLEPFHQQLSRIPTYEDREALLNIPIRRISRFDLDKNQEEIAATRKQLAKVEKDLKDIKKFTINYIRGIINKYGKAYPRTTQLQAIQQVDKRAMTLRNVKVGFDPVSGFVGTKVGGNNLFECTNFDKILLMFKDGTYTVINIPEKQYVHHNGNKVVYAGIADKKTLINVAYKNPQTHICFAKRFIITQFILDKIYNYIEEGMELQYISTAEQARVELQLIPKIKQKQSKVIFDFAATTVKSVSSKGIRMDQRPVKKIVLMK
ncbi:DNA topoisomerase 4 subunit A [Neochlamydia sp. EPS4]|jgi:topoisomerase-4 subunit A|uniref:DNA topoisomerase IV subunit A n=1 Tax=unclassified Neochlamydia TaxID=2643326 RepID=UPI00057F618B|nr:MULTISPECIES: DNA topoisomerase IV subunit A [unclassified Neochlamydia]KIC72712.1 DNA topoisomerase 4 subunit A [Neochlamydia sp. TUME1]KIC75438.1 DNA topoisomerase 4 subunit A [Neochlamydia sp. EPS4]BBI18168.1 DNA topoisomerase 4 subunit A [Neochlamydia sp. S13]